MRTGKPELQRRPLLSSSVMPSVSPLVRHSWSACSCRSSWTAAYQPIPPFQSRPSLSRSPPPPRRRTPSTRSLTGPWGICGSSLHRRQGSRPRWRHRSKSFPKTQPHTSGHRFALVHLNRHQPEPCRLNRCLCWHPSLTFSPDYHQMKNGTAGWVWQWGGRINQKYWDLTLKGFNYSLLSNLS